MSLIDRDELLEILRIMKERYFDRKIILGKVVEEVKRMPTIESERKKGKWFWGDGMYSCDQCHAAFYETSPFCPMCGADMRGEQE